MQIELGNRISAPSSRSRRKPKPPSICATPTSAQARTSKPDCTWRRVTRSSRRPARRRCRWRSRADALERHRQVGRQSFELRMEPPALMRKVGFRRARAECELPGQRYDSTRESRSSASKRIATGSNCTRRRNPPPAQDRETGVDQRRDLNDCLADDRGSALCSISRPMRTVTRLGVLQPQFEHRPITNPPAFTGNSVAQRVMILGASAHRVCGNSTNRAAPLLSPLESASGGRECAARRSAPMPVRVKPKDNWIGGNWP